VESVKNEQKSKQFITVQTKNGNYFYIIIDRSGDTENVYFLNLVDETDLFALLETEEDTAETEPITEPICICDEKCITGEVNPKCEVCRLTMSECVGWEVIQNPPDKSEDIGEKNNGGILLVLLLAAVGGGAAVWYFKYYKPKQQNKITSAPDEYEFDEEEEIEFEETEEV